MNVCCDDLYNVQYPLGFLLHAFRQVDRAFSFTAPTLWNLL